MRKLGPTLVLITRLSLDDPLEKARYWGSTLVDADAQAVINILSPSATPAAIRGVNINAVS